jgi:NAD(P)-dependent dehydrogenase (short-subunit alcohol dehydrogenase family)
VEERRIALITGAAQGIGRQTAVELAGRGYTLVLNDLRSADETLRDVKAAGGDGVLVVGDISYEETVVRLVEAVIRRYNRIDVLVNNAGVSLIQSAEHTTLTDWERVLKVNLTAPFLLCREVGREMLDRRSGSIVNVASVAGLLSVADRAAYNSSKHGLIGLTRTLAAEWGGRGVRVNAVCPGWVKTPMDEADQAAGTYSDADITNRIPMGRFATPDDVAKAIAFLADPVQSAFVNGHCLSVDGGWASDGSWDKLRLDNR